jgi:hypothetical protein
MKAAEYRKKGTRMFFKVENGITIRILNKEKLSVVTVADSPYIEEDALNEGFPCTKEEFIDAYHFAMERIQTMKL